MPTNHTNPSRSDRGDGLTVDMSHHDRMSDEQAHRLKALCWQRGERFDGNLTAVEAESRIAELEARVKSL